MISDERIKKITGMVHTSVDDCRSSLCHYSDPIFLCDLLVEFNRLGMVSKEKAVRIRIGQLIKKSSI